MTDPSPIRVLLVEDDPGDVRLTRERLADAPGVPFILEDADRLSAALGRLAQGGIDVILSDLGLPDAQGLEVVRRLRSQAPAVPLVVLTGSHSYLEESQALQALQVGAQDYLVKSDVNTQWLARSLRYAIGRKRAEEAQALLAAIVACSDDAIIGKDLKGVVTSWNKGAEHLYGWTAQEMMGHPSQIMLPSERREELDRFIDRLKRGQGVAHHETVRVRKDGREIPVSISISPVQNAAGELIGVATVTRDISALKREEEALRAGKERFQAIVETANSGIIVTDDRGLVTYANPAAETIFGHAVRDLVGRPFTLLMPERFRERQMESLKRFLETGSSRWVGRAGLPLIGLRKDSTEFPVDLSLSSWKSDQGTFFTAILRERTVGGGP